MQHGFVNGRRHDIGCHYTNINTISDVMSDDPQTIVTLQSKEEDEPCFVTIHKELLCFYSPYHDRLLNSGFAEGRIPRTEPLHIDAYKVVLEAFFKWLYTGKLPTLFPEDSSADELRSWYFQLTMLYVLADWMNCTALQRAIMSALVSLKPTILPSFEAIGALSDSSLESSQLYRYFADRYAEHWDGLSDGHCDIDSDDSMPQNFSHRVLLRRLRKDHHHDDSDQYIGYDCVCCHHPCRYHNHDDDVERQISTLSICDFDWASTNEQI
jgi:hypothetical protein